MFFKLHLDVRRIHEHPTFYFVHLLIPHAPYVYDAQCRPVPVALWQERDDFHYKNQPKNLPMAYVQKYDAYYAQMQCVWTYFESFISMLQERREYSDSTIIIAGDHGSRILKGFEPYIQNKIKMTRRDFIDAFSTLMVIKHKNQKEFEINTEQMPITDIISNLFHPEIQLQKNELPFVFLMEDNAKEKLEPHPMPEF